MTPVANPAVSVDTKSRRPITNDKRAEKTCIKIHVLIYWGQLDLPYRMTRSISKLCVLVRGLRERAG